MVEQWKIRGDDHVNFYDEQDIGVNAVLLTKAIYVPRVGEHVDLPGMPGGGAGVYEVKKVVYHYDTEKDDPQGIGAVSLGSVGVHLLRMDRPA